MTADEPLRSLRWWLRGVGSLYLAMFVIAVVARLPIREMGPPGVLDDAAAGDATARLLVDTWVIFGLELGIVGAVLWFASRTPERARPLVWAVVAIEAVRGIGADVYMLARGYEAAPQVIWIAVHLVVIGTALRCLRSPEMRHGAEENRATFAA